MLGVQQHGRQRRGVSKPPPAKGKAAARKYKPPQCPGAVRVVYIASPMKLTASPEEFRAVVQELTGRHSNIADRHYVDSATIDHPPPPPPACSGYVASATAAPPPVAAVPPPVLTPPLPPQTFQSYDHRGEHEQAAVQCYGQGHRW
uniref:VQ domain-containing protein n=1 Tax=Oryza meridionalis TaxID=40149 RepID=A0A0E0EGD9_9ORYZ